MTALGSLISPITLISETVLPEPDSPTTPTISWVSMRKEIPPTARSRPCSVRKETVRSRTSRSGFCPSGEADAGVEGGIGDIHEGIGEDDEEGGVHDGRHDHRQVEVLQRVIGELAHALKGEDHLGQERAAADQGAEIEAEKRDEGDERGPQRMAQQDAALAQALGAGGADIVLMARLHQIGA